MKELIELQRLLHVPKDKEGHKYKYRKVDDILKAVKEIAPDNVFITLSDKVINVGNFNYIESTATINNGKESISTSSSAKEGQLPGQVDPQISGSCSTYARKKALDGLFALDDSDDDPDSIKPNSIKPNINSKSDDLVLMNDEQKEHLLRCVDMLTKSGMTDKANGLKNNINDKTTFKAYKTLYNTACGYLGEKVQ